MEGALFFLVMTIFDFFFYDLKDVSKVLWGFNRYDPHALQGGAIIGTRIELRKQWGH